MGKKVNLNTDRGVLIHYPIVDGYPLYARLDSNIQEDMTSRTDKWKQAVEKVYNSPNNVKRVYFEQDRVYVEFHKSINNKGKSVELKGDNYSEMLSKGELDIGKSSGSYLTAIVYPWVCSNIEEIYFDWSMFISNDILNLGLGNLLDQAIGNSRKPIEISTIQYLFTRYCMNTPSLDINEVKSRFPRLKVVGYARDLTSIRQKINANRQFISKEDKHIKPWCAWGMDFKNAVDRGEATLWLLPDANKHITKSITRDNTYRFDKEYLAEYFEKQQRTVHNPVSNNPYTPQIEEMIERVLSEKGEKAVKILLRVGLSRASTEDIKELYTYVKDEYKPLFNGLI